MSGAGLALGVLGVWRISHLLHAENGPGDVVVSLRRALGNSVAGRAMDCFDCLSMWVALPFALVVGDGWREMVLAWPALSAAAMVLNRAVLRLRPPMPSAGPPHGGVATYVEDPPEATEASALRPEEMSDVQLRQGADERVDSDEPRAGTAAGSAGTAVTRVDHRV
jgi:hypothetical protein